MMDFWTRANANTLTSERHADDRSRVAVQMPTETNCPAADCGWDDFQQSAKKADCLTCGGVGKLITWQTYYLRARVSWTALMQLTFLAPTPGVEQGDVLLTIAQQDLYLVELVQKTARAYLIVDAKTVRPVSVSKLDVPHIGEEYQCVCNSFTPSTP